MTTIIKGVAMFANTSKPDKKYGKYSIAVTQLDEENVKALESTGLKARVGKDKKEAWGKYRVFRSQYPLKNLIDAKLQQLPEDFFIGNGSKVAVKFKTKQYDGLEQPAAYISTIQVIDLAEGEVDVSGFEEVEEGFAAEELPVESEFEEVNEELV